jgi:hypothetical protein
VQGLQSLDGFMLVWALVFKVAIVVDWPRGIHNVPLKHPTQVHWVVYDQKLPHNTPSTQPRLHVLQETPGRCDDFDILLFLDLKSGCDARAFVHNRCTFGGQVGRHVLVLMS